ncbi:MAG: hypothetical protein KAH32_07575, partial [Chlamydiia bacterium]|nr:hypothetical protein [Chlamydiia bacterium]
YTLYSTRFPCKRCTLAIIQSGISSIVCITPNTIDIWKHKTEYLESLDLFKESNTDITVILEGKIFSLHLLTKLITNSEERKK